MARVYLGIGSPGPTGPQGPPGLGFDVIAKTTSYTVLPGDVGNLITFNGPNKTATLPAAAPAEPWAISILNLHATALTISPNALELNGAPASITIAQSQGVFIWSDGANYWVGGQLPASAVTDASLTPHGIDSTGAGQGSSLTFDVASGKFKIVPPSNTLSDNPLGLWNLQPAAFTNPLAAQTFVKNPGNPVYAGAMSEFDIVVDSGTYYLFWSGADTGSLYLMTAPGPDGPFTPANSGNPIITGGYYYPSAIKDGTTWKLWANDQASPPLIHQFTATSPVGPWTHQGAAIAAPPSGFGSRGMADVTVRKLGPGNYMLVALFSRSAGVYDNQNAAGGYGNDIGIAYSSTGANGSWSIPIAPVCASVESFDIYVRSDPSIYQDANGNLAIPHSTSTDGVQHTAGGALIYDPNLGGWAEIDTLLLPNTGVTWEGTSFGQPVWVNDPIKGLLCFYYNATHGLGYATAAPRSPGASVCRDRANLIPATPQPAGGTLPTYSASIVPGQPNEGAAILNGANGFRVPIRPGLDPSGSFGIGMWVDLSNSPVTLADPFYLVAKGILASQAAAAFGWLLESTGGKQWLFADGFNAMSNTTVPTNQPVFLAVEWDAVAGKVNFYYNGQPDGSVTSTATLTPNLNDLTIGMANTFPPVHGVRGTVSKPLILLHAPGPARWLSQYLNPS